VKILEEQFGLAGRRAVVTGASGGIGRAVAVAYARCGADVLVVARSEEGLQATAALAADAPGTIATLSADLSDPAQAEVVTQRALEALGGIDVLVNNAGIAHASAVEDTSLETYQQVLDLNVRSSWLLCRAMSAALAAGDGGSVINVSSILGIVGSPNESAYVIAKHALIGATRSIALEWATRGVRVNALAPGYVVTPMTAPYLAEGEFADEVLHKTPMGRPAEADEMVGAAIFLASAASSYMTGQVLTVDGGWTAQ
jgi:NAD(P)-dependent dehydrogenase (short-subunit alcohol dehydrogenase family)